MKAVVPPVAERMARRGLRFSGSAGTHGVTERSSEPPPDRRRRCLRLKMRSFREGAWAVEHPSRQAGRLPQGPWRWHGDPHSLCCDMTTPWRSSRSWRTLGENEEKRPSRSAVGPAETSLPLTGDSRLSPTLLLGLPPKHEIVTLLGRRFLFSSWFLSFCSVSQLLPSNLKNHVCSKVSDSSVIWNNIL